ncbi:MAG TPA: methyltransferase domain-containing protein, partial [Firmicutes bacterium]|nr:methyltransferase domain-containing protein [Bacillota bacterium]
AIMIDIARGKVAKLRPPLPRRIDFAVGDAIDLNFADEKFDVVTVAFGVRNYSNIMRGLDEMYRVLKPGGEAGILEFFPGGGTPGIIRFYIHKVLPIIGNTLSGSKAYNYLLNTSDSFYTPDEFEKLLAEIGFVEIIRERMTFGIAHIFRARKGLS